MNFLCRLVGHRWSLSCWYMTNLVSLKTCSRCGKTHIDKVKLTDIGKASP